MELIGQTVEWELSGRGRGTIMRGEVVMYIPPGVTNEEAIEQLQESRPEFTPIRKRYCRFQMNTHSTKRVLVAVKQDTKRTRPIYWFYAPNVIEVSV